MTCRSVSNVMIYEYFSINLDFLKIVLCSLRTIVHICAIMHEYNLLFELMCLTISVHPTLTFFFHLVHLYTSLMMQIHKKDSHRKIRLGYCFTPYQRLWLYNGTPLVAFYDTLGIRRTYSRLKPPASSRGAHRKITQT